VRPKKALKEALIAAMANIPLKNSSKLKHNTPHKQGGPGRLGFPASPFPDLETLTVGLNSVFQGQELGGQVTVLARDPNLRSGRRSPSEIVTVRLKNGIRRRLFCKYGGYDWHSHGLWGVAYEVKVYQQVLATLDTTTAKFYGAYTAAAPNKIWLILEYLEDYEQLKNAPQPRAMIETVRWLGRFHATTEELLSNGAIPFLKIYDVEYYREWVNRTLEFAAFQHRNFPWLPPLCRKWEKLAEELLLPPTSIIHGDFYGTNISYRGLARRDREVVRSGIPENPLAGEPPAGFLPETSDWTPLPTIPLAGRPPGMELRAGVSATASSGCWARGDLIETGRTAIYER
jgi:hypothetical protein